MIEIEQETDFLPEWFQPRFSKHNVFSIICVKHLFVKFDQPTFKNAGKLSEYILIAWDIISIHLLSISRFWSFEINVYLYDD